VKTDAKILLVDHLAAMRWVMANLLHELGLEQIEHAEDGEKALAQLQQGGFDLLITDWNMPGMDGLTLLKRVREDNELSGLPVLMVASETRRNKIVEAIELGVDGYIVKPFTGPKLKAALEKILEGNWVDVD
jgi:two-component system chemotaxis response regulator CheY